MVPTEQLHVDRTKALDLAKRVIERSGQSLLERFHDNVYSEEGNEDVRSEIEAAILAVFPDHEVRSDMQEFRANQRRRWLLNVVDGEVNYIHRVQPFALTVSLDVDGVTEIALVYDCLRRETFYAIRGGGSFLNGVRSFVSDAGELADSLVATGAGTTARRDNGQIISRVWPKTHGLQMLGCDALALCYVAAGRLDLFWGLEPKSESVRAAKLILEEAEAQVIGPLGLHYRGGDRLLIAGPDTLAQELLLALELPTEYHSTPSRET